MFSVSNADLVAIRRAHAVGGRDAAMVELRRRCTGLDDATAAEMLKHILDIPFEAVTFAWRREPRRDRPKR